MLRRYAPMRQSRGTVIPASLRQQVLARDGYQCVVQAVGVDHVCSLGLELDHVRSSGALGKKSRTTLDNLVSTCAVGHRLKTNDGRRIRPLLIDWIDARSGDCQHVDVVSSCPSCRRRLDPLTLPESA